MAEAERYLDLYEAEARDEETILTLGAVALQYLKNALLAQQWLHALLHRPSITPAVHFAAALLMYAAQNPDAYPAQALPYLRLALHHYSESAWTHLPVVVLAAIRAAWEDHLPTRRTLEHACLALQHDTAQEEEMSVTGEGGATLHRIVLISHLPRQWPRSQRGTMTFRYGVRDEFGLFRRGSLPLSGEWTLRCALMDLQSGEGLPHQPTVHPASCFFPEDGRGTAFLTWSHPPPSITQVYLSLSLEGPIEALSLITGPLCLSTALQEDREDVNEHVRCFTDIVIEESWAAGIPGKVWDSAIALSRVFAEHPVGPMGKCLDLSSGTGFLGLYCLRFADEVTISDLETDLIQRNVDRYLAQAPRQKVTVCRIDWTQPHSFGLFDTILASDLIYDMTYFDALVTTLKASIRPGGRIFLGYKRRGLSAEEEAAAFATLATLGRCEALPLPSGPFWQKMRLLVYHAS